MSPAALAMAADLCRQFEGCRLQAYQDPVGIWTIGFGSTRLADGSAVSATAPAITMAEAEGLLEGVLKPIGAQIDAMVHVPLADHEAAALLSFAYNLGSATLRGSLLLTKLNAGDRAGAAAQFGEYCHAKGTVLPGLVRRRAAEAKMFVGSTEGLAPATS